MLQLYFSYTSFQSSRGWVLFNWLSANWPSCFPYKRMLMVSRGTRGIRVERDARILSSSYTYRGMSFWAPPRTAWWGHTWALESTLPISEQCSEDPQKHTLTSGALPHLDTAPSSGGRHSHVHLSLLVPWLKHPTLLPKTHFAWFSCPFSNVHLWIFSSVPASSCSVALSYLFFNYENKFLKIFLL